MARDINSAGRKLIQSFETLVLFVYDDQRRPTVEARPGDKIQGTLTIGWGHTGTDVVIGRRITRAEADQLFRDDLDEAEQDVESRLTRKPTSNQYAAMVSLAYNIGGGNFSDSTVLRKFNAGDIAGAAEAFGYWNKARNKQTGKLKVLPGLTRRRAEEKALFLKPDREDIGTTTPEATEEAKPRTAEKGGAVAIATGAGLSVFDAVTGSVEKANESVWGLPEKAVAFFIGAAVLYGLWRWWQARQAAKKAAAK